MTWSHMNFDQIVKVRRKYMSVALKCASLFIYSDKRAAIGLV